MHIVHTEASCGWGGQEIRILTESLGMVARGHQVTLLCPPHAKIFAAAQKRGLAVEALPIGRKNLKGFFAMRRWLATHRVDVINTHSSTDSWLAALACATLGNAPPLVRTRHISAPVPNNVATRWLYTKASAHVVTTGEKLKQTLIRDNDYPAALLTSVPTGIDTVSRYIPGDKTAARVQAGLPVGMTLVGIVATLRSWKGHRYLIDAIAPLEKVGLVIVGDGPQQEALQALVAEKGLRDRVWMPGNQENVVPWLQSLDVFALPSYANEGVPQALLQAMACGLPVVSTPVGSILEIIEHERTGLIVEPEKVEPLRAAIVRLLADAGLRAQLGSGARQLAELRFSSEIMLDKMEAVFRAANNPAHGRL